MYSIYTVKDMFKMPPEYFGEDIEKVATTIIQKWSSAPEDRAYENAGSGPVAVFADWYRLGVGADCDARYGAWVAVSRKVTPEVPKGVVLRGLSNNQIPGIRADLDKAQEAITAAKAKLQALE